MRLQGFRSPLYAKAFEGELWQNAFLGGNVLVRDGHVTNVYPYLVGHEYEPPFGSALAAAEFLGEAEERGYKSVAIVTSPLLDREWEEMTRDRYYHTLDSCKAYKPHYIVDYRHPMTIFGGHYENVKKFAQAGGSVVQRTLQFHNYIEYARTFYTLYQNLIKRHGAEGTLSDISERSLIHMFSAPGAVLFEALDRRGALVGAILCYIIESNAYYYLLAPTKKGYAIGANFALIYEALFYFKQLGLDRFVIGGYNDNNPDPDGGLVKFKKGWCNSEGMSYILTKEFK